MWWNPTNLSCFSNNNKKHPEFNRFAQPPPPLLQSQKYFCCQLVTSGFNSGFSSKCISSESFHNHSEGEKQPDTPSMKSWWCGQRTQVQMQIQRMAVSLWNPNHMAKVHANYHWLTVDCHFLTVSNITGEGTSNSKGFTVSCSDAISIFYSKNRRSRHEDHNHCCVSSLSLSNQLDVDD